MRHFGLIRADFLVALALTVGVVAGLSYGLYLLVSGRGTVAYDAALEAYNRGDHREALRLLEAASADRPDSVGVVTLLGWSYYRSGEYGLAEQSFRRATALDPKLEEARLGLAYASLANDRPTVALPLLEELIPKRPEDAELHLARAEARFKQGENFAAAAAYRDLIQRGLGAATARERLLALYGYPPYASLDDLPRELPPMSRSPSLVFDFRTRGNYFEVRDGAGWTRTYLKGVNIGPARPGEFPSTPPLDTATYREWLDQIGRMNANVVRAYTILPPAFYRALRIHNEGSPRKLWLVQEVWLTEREDHEDCDLYDAATVEEFQREIRHVIDLLHGRADIPYRRGHAAGIYTADVSPYVIALALGREVDPYVALCTNKANPAKTGHRGRFVSLAGGNATETWFAEMADLAIQYELERYHAQRPLTVVNWPPLDPIPHVTEANYAEEVKIRRARGEEVDEVLTRPPNDADAVALHIGKFTVTPEFRAGLFATYHVYSYWPDFMLYDPAYPLTRDEEGTNRYLGYLLNLKRHYPDMPVLIAEYGVPASWGVAHIHPEGWSNGGFSEQGQAELLVRMTGNIRSAGMAGGIVFAWQDEWWKRVSDDFTRPFMRPAWRKPLWLNQFDPEEHFGLLGYRPPAPVPLLRGEPDDWRKATRLIATPSKRPAAGALKAVSAFSDAAFLYLRLDIEKGDGAERLFDWTRVQYWIALNALPGAAGSRALPEVDLTLGTGATFLLQLAGPDSGRLHIAKNYNPQVWRAKNGVPGGWRLWRWAGLRAALEDAAPFGELIIEPNPPRYGRDGSVSPPLFMSRSGLEHGTADPASDDSSSRSAWRADEARGMIEVRIPWGLLYVMDPSSRLVLGGTDDDASPVARESPGMAVVALAVRVSVDEKGVRRALLDALPAPSRGRISADRVPVYAWPRWDRVHYEPYLKPSYFALQKAFGGLEAPAE